jgi:hypothetical protein
MRLFPLDFLIVKLNATGERGLHDQASHVGPWYAKLIA